jgi:hypothetical protein
MDREYMTTKRPAIVIEAMEKIVARMSEEDYTVEDIHGKQVPLALYVRNNSADHFLCVSAPPIHGYLVDILFGDDISDETVAWFNQELHKDRSATVKEISARVYAALRRREGLE